MMDIQVFLAQYIPNMERMEPRNVGVIVLSSTGLVGCKFIGFENGESVKNVGEKETDSVLVPDFVKSKYHYVKWVAYWRGLTDKVKLEYAISLQNKSIQPSYSLVPGTLSIGENLEERHFPDKVDYLFRTLVL